MNKHVFSLGYSRQLSITFYDVAPHAECLPHYNIVRHCEHLLSTCGLCGEFYPTSLALLLAVLQHRSQVASGNEITHNN